MELNIAVIGCGMIGREHIERIQNRIRGAKVVAVCDVFEEGAKKGAEIAGAGTKVYTDFNEAINDPDVNAVVVTTPGAFHKDPVIAAIKAGKPVFSEKPLANTAADCKAVVDAEMASGKHLVQVGFMRRYDRGYRQVKELLDSGKFGAPMVVKCTHRADGVAPDYTTSMAVTDTAIHEIDAVSYTHLSTFDLFRFFRFLFNIHFVLFCNERSKTAQTKRFKRMILLYIRGSCLLYTSSSRTARGRSSRAT